MSDEIAENGTANGDVPEIELIIKVTLVFTRVRIRLTKQFAARVAYSAFADFVKRWHLACSSHGGNSCCSSCLIDFLKPVAFEWSMVDRETRRISERIVCMHESRLLPSALILRDM